MLHPPVSTPSPSPSWHDALQDLRREHGFEPLRIEGTLPEQLRGTIYRNGATLLANHGRRYDHWFDGDGGICAVRFDSGRAFGAARVVTSAGLSQERRAGKLLYGGFGTVQPGLLRRLRGPIKNVANTSVMVWNDRLYALMEAALPTELCADDLTTIGENDLGGVVPRSFSAHPHAVPGRDALYNFGVRYGRTVKLDLFELRCGGPARRLATLPLPGTTLIHDFIATQNHLIFFVPPVRMRVLRMLAGRGGLADNLVWKPELGTEIWVVPIDDPRRPVRFTVDAFYQWHFVNAYERGDEILVDFVHYADFESNKWLSELFAGRAPRAIDGTLHRARIRADRRELRLEQLWDRPCEFPRVAPCADAAEYRYAYVAAHSARSGGRGFQDALARVDVSSGEVTELVLPPNHYTSEPVFVPRPGAAAEDDGFVLALVYDAAIHRSHCAVFDAQRIEAGPMARAHFDQHVPPRFHGVWQPA